MLTRAAQGLDLEDMTDLCVMSGERCRQAGKVRTREEHRARLKGLLRGAAANKAAVYVTTRADGQIVGLVGAVTMAPPPVYAPGPGVVLVSDLHLADGVQEGESTRALLNCAVGHFRALPPAVVIAPCSVDSPERAVLLEQEGFFVASEWHAKTLERVAEAAAPEGNAAVRDARADDVEAMADLAERKRQQYAAYAPRFWRPARDGRQKHLPFLGAQLTRDGATVLVAGAADPDADCPLDGFVIAHDGSVDDFAVATPNLWPTTGAALLREAERQSKQAGVTRMVVVCGGKDAPKTAILGAAGYTVVERWYVREATGGDKETTTT